jgi:arylsulfatase A-like enzyme
MGGHPQAKTLNIDRLMEMGVQFTHAYANVALCGPSRASFLTGLYPHTTGFYSDKNNWHRMRKCPKLSNSLTFMEHFWNNGYDVFGTGKIYHNPDHEDRVWKKQDGTPTYGTKVNWGPWPWDGKNPEGFGGPVHPSLPKPVRVDNMFASLADIPDVPPDPVKGTPGYKGWVLNNKPFRYVSEDDRDPMPDELNAAYAVKTLKAEHDHPFMLCVGIGRPHAPLIAPQKYFDMFPLDEVRLAVTKKNDLDDCSKVLTTEPDMCKGRWGFDNYSTIIEAGGMELLKGWTQAYLACIAFVDDQVGKILDAYEKSPYKENTYLVFVSDHGYQMGEKETLYKLTLWEEAGRIPFIVAGPGIKGGKICEHPVSLIDVYPTMTDLCGIPSDPNRNTNHLPLDGHSVKPFLKNPAHGTWAGPEVALTELANGNKHPKPEEIIPGKHHFAVRSNQYRYILCNNGEEELYDHKKDPYEWKNLANEPEYSTVKAELKSKLLRLTGQME